MSSSPIKFRYFNINENSGVGKFAKAEGATYQSAAPPETEQQRGSAMLEDDRSFAPLATQGIFNELLQAEHANMMPTSTARLPPLLPQPVFDPGPQSIPHWEPALGSLDQLQQGASTAFDHPAASNFAHQANPHVNVSLPPGQISLDQLQQGTSTAFGHPAASNFAHQANPQVNVSLPPGQISGQAFVTLQSGAGEITVYRVSAQVAAMLIQHQRDFENRT